MNSLGSPAGVTGAGSVAVLRATITRPSTRTASDTQSTRGL